MQRTNQNPENVCRLYEKSLNKSPEVTGKGCCSKYADCRGYERLEAFFSSVLVCLDTICHAVWGLSAISWPGPGPVTKHKNQYRLWTLGPWLLTPTSLRSHHLKASCQETHPSLMASVCWYPPMMTHSGMTRVMTHSEMTRVMAVSPTQHRCDSSWSGSEDRHKQISRGQTGK